MWWKQQQKGGGASPLSNPDTGSYATRKIKIYTTKEVSQLEKNV